MTNRTKLQVWVMEIRNILPEGRQQLVMQTSAIQMEKGFKNSLSPWQEEPQQENFSDNKPSTKSPHENLTAIMKAIHPVLI